MDSSSRFFKDGSMVGQYLKIWFGSRWVVGHVGRASLFLIFGWVDVGRGSCGSWLTFSHTVFLRFEAWPLIAAWPLIEAGLIKTWNNISLALGIRFWAFNISRMSNGAVKIQAPGFKSKTDGNYFCKTYMYLVIVSKFLLITAYIGIRKF